MPSAESPENSRRSRFAAIDLLRGVAILAMIVYHASWDLRANGLITADVVSDIGWKIFARSIAGTFVALSGFNLVLAARHGFRARPYLRRLAILLLAAGLVSLGTWVMDAKTFVFFGILHFIAAGSVLSLPFLRAPLSVTTIAAVLCLLAPHYVSYPVFNAPPWWWLGLSTVPPLTVDYVPVLPWLGVMLAGVVAAKVLLARGGEAWLASWSLPGRVPRVVGFVGRWSLVVYLIHQPILFGIISTAAPYFLQPAVSAQQLNDCVSVCEANNAAKIDCAATCGCVFTNIEGTDLAAVGDASAMTPDQRQRLATIIGACRTPQQ